MVGFGWEDKGARGELVAVLSESHPHSQVPRKYDHRIESRNEKQPLHQFIPEIGSSQENGLIEFQIIGLASGGVH